MNEQASITTPCAKVWVEDNILHIDYLHPSISLQDAKAHIQTIQQHYTNQLPLPNITNMKKVKQWPKEVRNYFASQEMAKVIQACALTGANGLAKIVGNLFLKFNHPPYPTKIFSNDEKAIEWLQEQ